MQKVKKISSKNHDSVFPQERLDRDLYVRINWANIEFSRYYLKVVGKCNISKGGVKLP